MKMLSSKAAAWVALLLIVVLIAFTFTLRTVWWSFIDIFFAFMMAFSHLVAVNIKRLSPAASRKLELAAAIFGCLFLIAFIGEFIAWQILF